MDNLTSGSSFLLMGFSNIWELQILHAALFLMAYLAALLGNLLIITLITKDHGLHTPMYFFLKNLSFLDLCLISITVPKPIKNSLTNRNTISFPGCVSQVFFFFLFATMEAALFTVMFYDHYVAICHPLRCRSPDVHQFFCEVPQLLALACSYNIGELTVIGLSLLLDFVCFVFMDISYIHIFSTVLRMPSRAGRSKAFSTCLSHLLVVTLFPSSGVFAYLRSLPQSPSTLDLLVLVFHSVVPPTVNPLIYSLRNKDMKVVLRKLLENRRPPSS
ncbi:olfactory receptor 14A16-like [Ictidomys tridecemlineatus]